MKTSRALPEEFETRLFLKNTELIELFTDLRSFIIDRYKGTNELLYHTHALTSVFSVSHKMSDGFCLVPIYSEHFNLGFQRGVLLEDPNNLLMGTGKLMRHIHITRSADFNSQAVKLLLDQAFNLALEDSNHVELLGKTISKIKS